MYYLFFRCTCKSNSEQWEYTVQLSSPNCKWVYRHYSYTPQHCSSIQQLASYTVFWFLYVFINLNVFCYVLLQNHLYSALQNFGLQVYFVSFGHTIFRPRKTRALLIREGHVSIRFHLPSHTILVYYVLPSRVQ